MEKKKFVNVVQEVQNYISESYEKSLANAQKSDQVRPYILSYLRKHNIQVEGYKTEELVDKIYSEMVEYSFLTPYLNRSDVEEININSWNDVAITFTDGHIEKTEKFFSPQHATDIVKRLLQNSSMIIDDACPIAQGHLPNNARITAIKSPIVDKDKEISVSIRLLHSSRITKEEIVRVHTATEEMFQFLSLCLQYGVSFIIAGATSSGKTTTLNALLNELPENKRIFTIESGTRELSLIHKDENGDITNNVVHTLSRPSETKANDISQEDLVVASLRFNPDVIVVGEMRDKEAYSAVEAALTGHTVVSTIHAFAAEAAHTRLALLTQKRMPIDFDLSIMQAAQAFPIVVYTRQMADNSRKILNISECVVDSNGKRNYHTLYQYEVRKNDFVDGKYIIEGSFVKKNQISESLLRRFINAGIPYDILKKLKDEKEM